MINQTLHYIMEEVKEKSLIKKTKKVRTKLIELQQKLRKCDFPVIILFAGVNGAGKHETIDKLNEWMDPRWLNNHAFGKPSDDERQRPNNWKYWEKLPPKGQIGLYLNGWQNPPLLKYAREKISKKEFIDRMQHIADFEKMLKDDGALIIKFWMHIDEDLQEERYNELKKDPLTSWQVETYEWEKKKYYKELINASEIMFKIHENTPWTTIDGADSELCPLVTAKTILKKIKERMKNPPVSAVPKFHSSSRNFLKAHNDLKTISKAEYTEALHSLQGKLYQLHHEAHKQKRAALMLFEGWDAAGKGGAIRRMVRGMDARHYNVIPIGAPTKEEHKYHYLWRFWKHIPKDGEVTIFDRTWYGRVLVERIEGFATEAEWKRAYQEINDFEEEMVNHGIILCKFWMNISQEVQLERFNLRKNTPHKSWKLTEEDWRNREKWGLYEEAVNDMIAYTHNDNAPWNIIEGNDKSYARIKVLKKVCQAFEDALKK